MRVTRLGAAAGRRRTPTAAPLTNVVAHLPGSAGRVEKVAGPPTARRGRARRVPGRRSAPSVASGSRPVRVVPPDGSGEIV